jgi:hypothetical protein
MNQIIPGIFVDYKHFHERRRCWLTAAALSWAWKMSRFYSFWRFVDVPSLGRALLSGPPYLLAEQLGQI